VRPPTIALPAERCCQKTLGRIGRDAVRRTAEFDAISDEIDPLLDHREVLCLSAFKIRQYFSRAGVWQASAKFVH
jgi:hypothetical protein